MRLMAVSEGGLWVRLDLKPSASAQLPIALTGWALVKLKYLSN